MIRATVGDLLIGELRAGDCRLYVVRDGDVVFYVGQSSEIASRLWEHLGVNARGRPTDKSRLGRLILDNAPGSKYWQIELYSVKELGIDSIDLAEEALIGLLRPCLNVTYNNDPSPLPDCYIDREAQEAAQSRAVLAAFGESGV